jgi:hypothetical protein
MYIYAVIVSPVFWSRDRDPIRAARLERRSGNQAYARGLSKALPLR